MKMCGMTMRIVLASAFVAVAALAGVAPAIAHHSRAAFDENLPVTVTGRVSKVEWTSPHARLYVDAEEDGATVTWDFELPSPVTLMRRGWTRSALQEGDEVRVVGIRAREHPHIAVAAAVTDGEGNNLFSGDAAGR